MIKTSVTFAVATIAVCGAVAFAANKSPAHDQAASQVKPAAATETGLPKIYPDVVDPNGTRWMPVIYG